MAPPSSQEGVVFDALNRNVPWPRTPERIVSLCPSQTELLFDLGLGQRVVGRTRFCVHPQPQVQQLPVVGGTKNARVPAILALQPQLVLAEMEEQTPQLVAALEAHVPVYVTRVESLHDAWQMIARLGELLGAEQAAQALVAGQQQLLQALPRPQRPWRTAYLIWKKPWMAAGKGTYIHSLLEAFGLHNAVAHRTERYPVLELEELRVQNPEIVLLSSEPYPFGEAHRAELQAQLPQAIVQCVDGELFSWYGSRLNHLAQAAAGLARAWAQLPNCGEPA